MADLNTLIHQPTRLKIMATLSGLDKDAQVDFTFLKEELSLSDGNLSIQLQKLEESGLIIIQKEFVKKRPKTWVKMSDRGRLAFASYIDDLKKILGEQ